MSDNSSDTWAKLAAPFDASAIRWRAASKPVKGREGFVSRYVAYLDAGQVRERLDACAPGWGCLLKPLEWTAAVDAYWIWSRPDPEQPGTLKVRGRVPPIGTLSVELSPDSAVCRGTVARVDRRENQDRVFAVLSGDAETALDVPAIVTASGLPDSTARKALDGLRHAKLAATIGDGVKGDPVRWYALRSVTEA